MNQSNNTQKTLKPKNPKKYTEAVNLGKKLSKTPDITKVSVATQMFELIHDEDREIISKAFMEGANLTENQLTDIANMIVDDYGSRWTGGEVSEVIGLILENISGFETVDSQALTQTINEIRKRYDDSVEQHSENANT